MSHYTNLAKTAVETFVRENETVGSPKNLSKEMLERRAGVFVTIKKNGGLRACIGTYLPTKRNIAEEIIGNAISAATKDHRFGPIEKPELPFLSYEVYVLEKPEPVQNIKDLNPSKYGIIARGENNKTGLLLPGLEGINDPEEQISIACKKAGVDPATEKISLYRFKAQKYESKE